MHRGPGWLAWHRAAARAAWSALPFEPDLIFAHFVVAGVPAVILGRLHRKPVAISENWGIFLPDNPDPVTLRLRLAARCVAGRTLTVRNLVAVQRAGASLIAVPAALRNRAVERALEHMPALAAAVRWLEPGSPLPAAQ